MSTFGICFILYFLKLSACCGLYWIALSVPGADLGFLKG